MTISSLPILKWFALEDHKLMALGKDTRLYAQSAAILSIAVFSVLLETSVCLFGQAETGQVSGIVTDPSKAVVAGAQVAVASSNTGLVRHTTTGLAGQYTIPSLKPDTYTLTVEHLGFQKYTRLV
jgi:hypothetical protein